MPGDPKKNEKGANVPTSKFVYEQKLAVAVPVHISQLDSHAYVASYSGEPVPEGPKLNWFGTLLQCYIQAPTNQMLVLITLPMNDQIMPQLLPLICASVMSGGAPFLHRPTLIVAM